MKPLIPLVFLLASCATDMSSNTRIVTIEFVEKGRMGSQCSIMAIGCAVPDGNSCTIFVPRPPENSYGPFMTEDQEYYVIGHELLHCYGWNHESLY